MNFPWCQTVTGGGGGFLIGRAVNDVPSETQRHDAKEEKKPRGQCREVEDACQVTGFPASLRHLHLCFLSVSLGLRPLVGPSFRVAGDGTGPRGPQPRCSLEFGLSVFRLKGG